MSFTRQCPICGHHEHYPERCGVGTPLITPVLLLKYPLQQNCDCDGLHKESIIEDIGNPHENEKLYNEYNFG